VEGTGGTDGVDEPEVTDGGNGTGTETAGGGWGGVMPAVGEGVADVAVVWDGERALVVGVGDAVTEEGIIPGGIVDPDTDPESFAAGTEILSSCAISTALVFGMTVVAAASGIAGEGSSDGPMQPQIMIKMRERVTRRYRFHIIDRDLSSLILNILLK